MTRSVITLSLIVLSWASGLSATENEDAIVLVDRAAALGVDFVYQNGMTGRMYMPEMVGGGVALFDQDGDGDLDLWLVQGSSLGEATPDTAAPGDVIFRNQTSAESTELNFRRIESALPADGSGYGHGIAVGDYDNDGDLDAYVTRFGRNALWRNDGSGTFEEVAGSAGVDDPKWSVPAVFLDYDNDGWLDLFVGNYVEYSLAINKECRTLAGARDYCGPLSYEPSVDRLYRNLGNGRFEDRTEAAGLGVPGAALGAVAADFNGDGLLDLYVANDGMANRLWFNQGDGTFRDEALLAGTAVNRLGRPEASMGVAAGDFDSDGRIDLFLTHLDGETNTLYRNQGEGFFEDATGSSGLGSTSVPFTGFGTAWLDLDRDGLLDLLAVNGAVHTPEQKRGEDFALGQRNLGYRQTAPGRFADITSRLGAAFERRDTSRGLAVGDLDSDGDLEVVISNIEAPLQLLVSTQPRVATWVGIEPRIEVSTGLTRLAEGARVAILGSADEAGAHAPLFWRRPASNGSYASASDPRALFEYLPGAAISASGRVQILVEWLSGTSERFEVSAGRYTTVIEGEGRAREGVPAATSASGGASP